VSLANFLAILDESRYNPASDVIVRLEPREIIDNGQYGFDYGWVNRASYDDEDWEIKRNPTNSDVREFVARTAGLLATGSTHVTRFIAGSPTAPYNRLRAFVQHGREAVSEKNLHALIAAAGDTEEHVLLELLGDDPFKVLAKFRFPRLVPETTLDDQIDFLCRGMAVAGRGPELRSKLERALTEAAKTRSVIVVGGLAARLIEDGLLVAPSQVDVSQVDSDLIPALTLLQTCPLPVPIGAVSAALGLEDHQTTERLAEQVALGRVINEGDHYGIHTPAVVRFPPEPVQDKLMMALEYLMSAAPGQVGIFKCQTPNAVSLARECLHTYPVTVAGTFTAFDKASKAYGDLSLIYELARISTEAVGIAIGSHVNRSRELAENRARNYICGTAWVLQRVEELEEAESLINAARDISAAISDARTVAFADKCSGRLDRMRAERESDADAKKSFFDRSERLLRKAHAEFTDLVSSDTGLIEDVGECLSLLARAQFSRGNAETAVRTVADARKVLDATPSSKAYADLVILDVELALHSHEKDLLEGGVGNPQVLSDAEGSLAKIISEFEPISNASRNRAASEIVGRVYLVLGSIYVAQSRVEEARAHYSAAAKLYEQLNYPDAAARAAWLGRQQETDAVPDGLLRALKRHRADAAVCLEALAKYDAWRAGSESTAVQASVTALNDAIWEGFVSEATAVVAAKRPRWGEGRVTA
jgi:tetratricopeptide (TPR) repeat protein